ncbi:MAG: dockerin type I repeat-containing protein, partial [Oscillospiraceae bacterium]|nr:dockerin type I repeat-containing protein [Oscillospiraceae bacterium]
DTKVTVKSITEDGRWAKVEYRGVTGYCVTEYLKEAAPAADAVIRGDVNGNREIGPDDAQIALKAYTERIAGIGMQLTETQIKAADITGDGQVSVEDAQWILKYYTVKYVSAKDITWDQLLGK